MAAVASLYSPDLEAARAAARRVLSTYTLAGRPAPSTIPDFAYEALTDRLPFPLPEERDAFEAEWAAFDGPRLEDLHVVEYERPSGIWITFHASHTDAMNHVDDLLRDGPTWPSGTSVRVSAAGQ